MRWITVLWILTKIKMGFADDPMPDTCGTLEAKPRDVPVNSEAALYFTYTVRLDIVYLQHRAPGGSFRFVDGMNYEVTSSTQRPLSVFKIHHSQYADSGTYRVYCSPVSHSTEAELVVKMFPPSPPVFSDTADLYDCQQCLSAWPGRALPVVCSTWNGTEPVAMEIRKNNIKMIGMSISRQPSRGLKGLVSFVPRESDHEAELVCFVKNSAASHPLITTTKIYIQHTPDIPTIGVRRYTENQPANITCSSNGGRPPPSLFFMHSDVKYYKPTTILTNGDDYFVHATLTAMFTRDDNEKKIKCCSEISKDQAALCSYEKLRVNFPPRTVKMVKLHETSRGSGLTRQVLQCTVGKSNPASSMEWGGLEGIQHNISATYVNQGSYSNLEKTQAVSMLLAPSDNKRAITCTAKNKRFPDARPTTTVILNVTYAPSLSILPEGNITLTNGNDVRIVCSVDSNPASTVVWINGTGQPIRDLYTGHILTNLELDLHDVSINTSSTFTCMANNGIGTVRRKSISIIIADKAFDKLAGTMEETGGSEVTAIVVCLLFLVVMATIALIAVVIRRRRKHEVTLADAARIHVEDRQPGINPPLDEPVYNNINNMNKLDDTQEMKHTETTLQKRPIKSEPSELVYAELSLSDGKKESKPFVRPHSETEYVAIDFTKNGNNHTAVNDDKLE